MSQEMMDMQMHFLESRLNGEATCIFWELGVQKEIKGKLSMVVPFDRVAIGG